MAEWKVVFLPQWMKPADVAGRTVVVTDVLRASTTMVAALEAGASRIRPTPDIPTALEWKDRLGPSAVLGGERGGVIIPGFHAGNSPREFTAGSIGGRELVLCTTNGTVALESCREARRVLIGALVNVGAVADRVREDAAGTVLCAGTDGHFTSEDLLFAGALLDALMVRGVALELDDRASVALAWWRSARRRVDGGERLATVLGEGRGGRNLLKLGYDADIEFCADVDRLRVVPELDREAWTIGKG